MRFLVKQLLSASLVIFFCSCDIGKDTDQLPDQTFIYVLGVAQDGGYPQAGCLKKCCIGPKNKPELRRWVSSIAIVDNAKNRCWIFDATPDFREQLQMINDVTASENPVNIAGIFLTHAHVGHYTGLAHLGLEVMGANKIPVYAMPRMMNFLTDNGPWSQLVTKKNINVEPLQDGVIININDQIKITPFFVPHRDEYSETVGFHISGPNKSVLFIPDIDKWELWQKDIVAEIERNDYLFLDATFFDGTELPGRNMSQIPHPFVVESMQLFANLSIKEKQKIHFIHFNHTNPLYQPGSNARKVLNNAGFQVAEQGKIINF
ncbi:MAG TPA: pyrroloquinoline quinone biosynthesis protein PqqB [Candidatus Marinimicrobia bacterium]|nr:pyrroloquinoline quinone biosynthesis protein PqqB [Candidatus Neomarinimicrobiota bacterium]